MISQIVFLALFVFAIWATWTSRLGGYPVSGFLEINPLVGLSTFLATGYVYHLLGWGLVIVALTFAFGRVFCNWICPLGTLQQFVHWLFNNRTNAQRIDTNRYHSRQFIKYAVLIILLILSSLGALQIGLLDPIVIVYRSFTTWVAPANDALIDAGSTWLPSQWVDTLKFAPGVDSRLFVGGFWIGLVFFVILAISLWKPRFFCRILCPLGALLGVLASRSLWRINRITARCTDCNLCLTRCEGAADPQSKLRSTECFGCMNCLDDCPEDALVFTLLNQDREQVLAKPDMSKRQLVFAGIAGLSTVPMLRSNGKSADENFSPAMIRPPGSVAETQFLERCIKCDQCINACPTNVLQPAGLSEGGIEALWTPVMNFRIAHCQYKCTLCSQVCPTGAIRRINVNEKLGLGEHGEQGPIRLGTAFFDRGRCLPWANQIPCVVCEEVCPVAPKAIQTIDEEVKDVFANKVILNKPFMVPDLCIGCGICEAECPVQDRPAVYVTAVGESRSKQRRLLLQSRAAQSQDS